jgi:hypothetical protein
MTMRIAEAALNAAVNGVVDLVDAGGGGAGGFMRFYTGTPPASLTDAPGGTLLAEVDLADPAFGNAAAGSASALGVPIATTGLTDGTIGWARVLDTDGADADVLIDDDDVGTGANNIQVNTTTVSTGVDFELTSYAFNAIPQT